jgi:hypothetical protein
MEGIKRDLQGQELRLCSVPLLFYHVFRHYQGHRRYDNALDVLPQVTLWPLHAISLSKIDGRASFKNPATASGLITPK